MSGGRMLIGDVFAGLAQLEREDVKVDLVLTSPPFLALRSYLPADHVDKGKEIGSEPTPGEYIDILLDVVEACDRVLAPHGSMVFELGDSYSGSGGGGGDYLEGGMREGQAQFAGTAASMRESNAAHWRQKNVNKTAWPLDKSLCLVPELFRVALVYGFNPLTGRTTPRWRARNVIRWTRPNPPVGALGDKFRPATSDMVVITKAKDRYFDLDAVRSEPSVNSHGGGTWTTEGGEKASRGDIEKTIANPAGAPPLDWWCIPTEPFKGSHYATWPRSLLTRPILAMAPQRVCRTCGEPSRRIVEVAAQSEDRRQYRAIENRLSADTGIARSVTTLGWTDCGHDDWRPGHVLDPFGGSGTTGVVATGHGRDCTLIDIDARNADLARERIGMFLTVEHMQPATEATA